MSISRPIFALAAGALASVCFFLAAGAAGAGVESDLNRLWKGAWVVVGLETASSCSGSYTNNAVRGRLVSSKGERRFEPGELAAVHKVNVQRNRLEVFLDLVEPVLVARVDGPFTLYDESHCKAELRFELERTDRRALEALDAFLQTSFERYPSLDEAERSESWNRRTREPYPPDYDRTLAEHEIWKAIQFNGKVQTRLDESIEEAARLVDRVDDEPEYLDGFAAGVDEGRDSSWSRDCDRLLSLSEHSWVERPPKGSGDDWKDGYRDGQRLVFHLERARRLRDCFVPPPY